MTSAATLATYGSALLLEHRVGEHVDLVVLAVAVAAMLGSARRAGDRRDRLASFVVIPLSAAVAAEIGSLMTRHPLAGDTLFTLAISSPIWMRRFGARVGQAGAMTTVPLVAILISPVPPQSGASHVLWVAVAATIALGWVTAAEHVAQTVGSLRLAVPRAAALVRTDAARTKSGPLTARLRPSTRMAVQMAASAGLAFAIGRALFPGHWNWMVLTAYIVCSGNRGRADVLYKGVLRVVGASVGTAAAGALASRFAPGDPLSIVAIFAVLFVAGWLRPFNYAYWAGCITGALALLYGYFGQAGAHLLGERLEEILVGAVLAILASSLVLPIKTRNVFRQRAATALAALSDILTALRSQPAELKRHQRRFATAVAELEQIEPPLRAYRRLLWRFRQRPSALDAIDVFRTCRRAAEAIASRATADPNRIRDLGMIIADTSMLVASARRQLGNRETHVLVPQDPSVELERCCVPPPATDQLGRAMAELHGAVRQLPQLLGSR